MKERDLEFEERETREKKRNWGKQKTKKKRGALTLLSFVVMTTTMATTPSLSLSLSLSVVLHYFLNFLLLIGEIAENRLIRKI